MSSQKNGKLVIDADLGKHTINKNIYGHFAEHLGRCIYDGIFVGKGSPIPNTDGIRIDVVEALRKIKIPVLRWPGGCFADAYHWKDAIGPLSNRKKMLNTHWGMTVEDNSFGTHEFFQLCELLETDPYICGNLGSGSIQEMCDWVEYMNIDGDTPMSEERKKNGRDKPWGIKYFGVGNEAWGCGGRMRAEFYADNFRRYAAFVRTYGQDLFLIAAGPRNMNYHWTEVLIREAVHYMDGLGWHYYTRLADSNVHTQEDGNQITVPVKGMKRGSATEFVEKDWFGIMKSAWLTDEIAAKHSTLMDKYDPAKKVALIIDEWGTWFDNEPGTNPRFLYQQNTLRDAVSAAVSLNIFNSHADRLRMANIAQTVNVLQAMVLTEGSKMVLTPSYHVFDLFKDHQDGTLLPSSVDVPSYNFEGESLPGLSVSSSKNKDGDVVITLANPDPDAGIDLTIDIRPLKIKSIKGKVLSAKNMQDYNDFTDGNKVRPENYTGAEIHDGTIRASVPSKSVTLLICSDK